MNRKAQSALEFLMTYGWAILVVLAAIGALAYFGVLNPTNFLPDQCTASTGWGCVGKPAIDTNGNIMVVLTNGAGGAVTLYNGSATVTANSIGCTGPLNLSFCAKGSSTCTGEAFPVQDGTDFQMYLRCSVQDKVHKATVKINYTSPVSGLQDQVTIQIAGKKRT